MSPSRSTERRARFFPLVVVALAGGCGTGGGSAAASGGERDLSVADATPDASPPAPDAAPPAPDVAPPPVPDAALPDTALPDAAPPEPDAAPPEPDAAPDPVQTHETFALEGVSTCLNSAADRLTFSFQLTSGEAAILPFDHLGSEVEPVEALATPEAFGFGAPDDLNLLDGTQARLTPEDGGESVDVPLTPSGVGFEWRGGPEHRHEQRLLILMVDQSASMGGTTPDGALDLAQASDPLDARLDLLRTVVEDVPADWWLSLVWFNGRFATLSVEFATPTLNRLALSNPGSIAPDEDGLGRLQIGESGGTPLADALNDVLTRIVDARSNTNLNAQVVLVTDGVEEGDPSAHRLEAVVPMYAEHVRDGRPAPVPVTVVHLARRTDGVATGRRAAELAALACRTGGDYLFVPDPQRLAALAERPRAHRFATGLTGLWRLEAHADLGAVPASGHLLSTRLRATLGGLPQSFDFEAPADAAAPDTRGFLFRP